MRVINVSLSELESKVLLIGFEGENQITQVRIDAAEIFTDHPNATPTLIAKPLFGFAYPVIVTKEGTDVVWEIDNSVLSFHGDGEIQLTFTEGTVIAKSYVGRIRIKRSLAVNGEAPDPIETWEQAATAKLAEVDAQIGELEDMVEAAEAAKDEAQGIVDDAAADIQAAGAAQVQVVQAKGTEVINSIPSDYTALTGDVNGLKSAIGELDDLTTTDKDSVVDAINEVKNSLETLDSETVKSVNSTTPDNNGNVNIDVSEYVPSAVDDWLDDHPEATTTVEDGSLTLEKFVLGANGYITPQQFNAKGDGVTDDKEAIQNAVDYAIQHSIPLYFPAGTYIISNVIQIGNITASGQGLTMIGAGIGKTIIKEKDGTTAAGGRYQKMFYCYLYDASVRDFDFGDYVIRGFTFDKNGRSNGDTQRGYQWEGAHIICFQGDNTHTINSIILEECEFVDKIGCGVAIGPSTTKANLISIRDIVSLNHPTVSAGIVSQKGDIEIAIDSELTVMERVNVIYSQIERADTYNVDRVCRTKIANSVFGSLEYHYTPFSLSAPKTNIYLDIVNTTCTHKLHVGGIHTQVINSTFRCPEAFTCPDMKVSNCTILLPYRETTDESTGVIIGTVYPFYGFINNNLPDCYYTFVGCEFKPDVDFNDVQATAFGGESLRAVIRGKSSPQVHFTIDGCTFDAHYGPVCNPYSYGGDYVITNCRINKISSDNHAFIGGSYASYWSRLIISDCDFSGVEDNKVLRVQTGNANSDYCLEVHGDYDGTKWKQGSNNAGNVLPDKYTIHPRLHMAEAPSSANLVVGFVGDTVINTTPSAGGNIGWVCTTAGAVGTWKPFGAIGE